MLSEAIQQKPESLLQPTEQLLYHGVRRWLHCIDMNQVSKTYGYCDREYWAWKLKDYNNCVTQCGLSAFLDSRSLFPELKPNAIVDAVIHGTAAQQRGNGSFDQAYPFESSVCGTAIVIFNLLYSYYCHPECFTQKTTLKLKKIVIKSRKFLDSVPEAHGVIANHQATIIFSRILCAKFLHAEGNDNSMALINDFLMLQHEEGWFFEYSGADPGYQTLLNHYINAFLKIMPNQKELQLALQKSLDFCELFAFQDGTFSGELGVRGTNIIYPSGIYSNTSKPSKLIAWFEERYLSRLSAVTPLSVDINNFAPVLNSWALYFRGQNYSSVPKHEVRLPQLRHISLPEAGYEIYETNKAKIILSKKTAVLKRCYLNPSNEWKSDHHSHWTFNGYTTQHCFEKCVVDANSTLKIYLGYRKTKQMLNNVRSATIIRLIAILIYPFPRIQNLFKKLMAKTVMGATEAATANVIEIEINLDDEVLPLRWQPLSEFGAKFSAHPFGFQAHMASANTFQNFSD